MTSLQVCYIGCVVRAHSLQVNFACSLFDPLTYCFLLPRLEENQGLEKRLSLTPTIGYQLLYLGLLVLLHMQTIFWLLHL